MNVRFDSEVPIYIQIAEQLENGILSDIFKEECQVPSTTEISVTYKINPATVLKGMNLLVDHDILYKKRGVGMFVASGAKDKILKTRQQSFYESFIVPLLHEAQNLNINKETIIKMIESEDLEHVH